MQVQRKGFRENSEKTEDEMAGWHHPFSGHELAQTSEIVKGREAWRAAVLGVSESDVT